MKKKSESCGPNRKKNWSTATGLEPLLPSWGCPALHTMQQFKTVSHAASTQNSQPYFQCFCCFSHSEKTKESSFAVFQETQTFLEKISPG